MQPIWKKVDGHWIIAEFGWSFSNFNRIKNWVMSEEPPMGEHMRTCEVYQTHRQSYQNKPMALLGKVDYCARKRPCRVF